MTDNVIPISDSEQFLIDRYYRVVNKGKPCCAGCDWWRWYNSILGECTKSAPVSQKDRLAVLGIKSISLDIGAGHILTNREHVCGDFVDTYDWGSK